MMPQRGGNSFLLVKPKKSGDSSLLQTWGFRLFLLAVVLFAVVLLWLAAQPPTVFSPHSKTTKIRSSFEVIYSTDRPYNHLIIVPGHSVMNFDGFVLNDVNSDRAWKLLDYQEEQELPKIISEHIATAINVSRNDQKSLLIFSGGQTRMDAGPVSEALSYYLYSRQKGWLSSNLDGRVFLEEYSRDSYENIIFSICRFNEVAGVYPSTVTIVGFDFKAARYVSLHRVAIDYPDTAFKYIGLRPTTSKFDHKAAAIGEKNTFDAFHGNMYGCSIEAYGSRGPYLRGAVQTHSNKSNTEPVSAEIAAKRSARNPFLRSIPYELSCPDIAPLLHWCGPGLFGEDNSRHYSLPWNKKTK